MDYGEILSKAWKIIWKYKILWVFGILAALGEGSGSGGGNGRSSLNRNSSDFSYDPNGMTNLPPEMRHAFENMTQFFSSIPVWVWVLLILGLIVISLIVWALSIMGKTGLVVGAHKGDQGVERLTFGELWSSAGHYFWRILGFMILAIIAILLLMMVIFIPMGILGAFTAGVGMLCMVPLICLIIPVMLLLNIILEQSIIAIVIEDLGIFDGLKRGWMVFKGNIWSLILMAIILGVMSGIISFIISLPLLIAFAPLLIPMLTSITSGSIDFEALRSSAMISLGLCCVIYPFVLVAEGILTSYVQSAWTLTYLRLTNRPVAPVMPQPEIPGEVPPAPNQL